MQLLVPAMPQRAAGAAIWQQMGRGSAVLWMPRVHGSIAGWLPQTGHSGAWC